MTEPHTSQHEPSTGLWDAAYRWLFDTSFESGYARLIENSIGWLIIQIGRAHV